MNTETNTGINTEMNTKIKSEIKTEIKTEIGEDIKVEQEDSLEKSHGFICAACSAHFLCESYFLEHIKEHHSVDHNIQTAEKPKKKFRCPRIQTYRCTRCSYHSNNKYDLNKHNIIVHAGLKPLHKCSYCPFACIWKVNTTRHERIHTGNKPFSCNECPYTASRADKIKEHAQKHRNEKPFKCSECDVKFIRRRDCAKHMRQKHPEMNADSASERCDSLKKRQITLKDDASSEKKNMLGHREQPNEKPFSCNECSYTANTAYQLKEHAHKHRKEKPFSCNECSYTANTAYKLKEHAHKHRKEKPFSCNVCSYTANTAHQLKEHAHKHRNEKPFNCNECSYTATRANNLRDHILANHRNMKPFKCATCGNKYVRKRDCAKHQRQKHPEMNADSASEPFDWLTKRQITLKDEATSDKDNPGQIYQQSIADSPSEKRVPRTKQSEEKPYKCLGN